jgi:hypothetical protein
MKFFRCLFSRLLGNSVHYALRERENHLSGCMPPTVVAQAKARAVRRMGQGCCPAVAVRLAITWALNVDHREAMS